MAQVRRCQWIMGKPAYYIAYHDQVWGKPEHRDQALFKWLVLEAFHVGLSWQLVLSKLAHFEAAFDGFDYHTIALYDESKIRELMCNQQLIRHEGKIRATITNAQAFFKIQAEFGSFDAYIWAFTQGKVQYLPVDSSIKSNALSDIIAKDLKARGFKFLGSITVFSYLQGIGIFNSHDEMCEFR